MITANIRDSVAVGPYRVLQRLGKGGMGTVYLAIDERLDRYVALKMLDGLSLEKRKSILAEAKVLAKLNHPSIVQIYDVIEHEGQPILVMEYVEGEDLEKLIRHQTMSVVSTIRVAISIASALTEAHSRSIVHNDLKLANILFTPSGGAKLTDFGIAQLLYGNGMRSMAKGSVTALSPEKISGVELDGRSDLFSLGVIIYQMLSGRAPFNAVEHSRTYFQKVLHEPHLPLSSFMPTVPEALSVLVDQLLEKNPSLRPASAAEVKNKLESIEVSLTEDCQDTLILTSLGRLKGYEACAHGITGMRDRKVGKSDFVNYKLIAVIIVALIFGSCIQAYLEHFRSEPIKVAVLLPTIKNPLAVPSKDLLKTSVHQSILDALLLSSNARITVVEQTTEFEGHPVDIGRKLQVDEVLASYLECVGLYCHTALRRYSQSGLKELADLKIPIDSFRVMDSLVGNAVLALYPHSKQSL